MGWLQDILKEVPLSAVAQERVKLAEQRYAAANEQVEILKQRVSLLEKENAELRAQIPPTNQTAFGADTTRVLVHLFKADNIDARDIRAMADTLGMALSVLKYHLDQLEQADCAEMTGGNYVTGATYWALTPAGRRKVVEDGLT